MTVADITAKDFGDVSVLSLLSTALPLPRSPWNRLTPCPLQIVLTAKNMAGEAQCQAFFGFVPIKPSIEGDFPKMSEVKEGGEFVLSAKVDGSPPPTAIW